MGNAIGTTADTPHHHHGVIKKRLLRWENSGFSQRIEKLPTNNNNNGGAAELRTTNNNNNNNTAADDDSTQRRKIQQLESQLHTDTNNLKIYSIFGALLTFIGFVLSIVGPVMSCSFGIITWSDDENDGTTATTSTTNNNTGYQLTITNVGLFTWYNPNTSSCWAYSPLDTEYFYVDGTARGMAIASLFFGGCAMLWILGRLVSIFILGRSDIDSNDSGDRNNSNNNSNNSGSIKLRVRITFLTLAGLTLLASITQISTLTYFLTKKNEGNNNYVITCNNYKVNGKEGNCSKGIGAHDAIIAFLFYLLACVVYTIAGVKCCIQVNNEKNRSNKRRFHKRGVGGKGGKKNGDDEELYKSTIDVHKCTSASCYCNNGGLENVSFIPVVAASNDTKKSGDELTRQAKMAAATTAGGVVGSTTTATNTVNKEYEYWYPEASRISDEGSDI